MTIGEIMFYGGIAGMAICLIMLFICQKKMGQKRENLLRNLEQNDSLEDSISDMKE